MTDIDLTETETEVSVENCYGGDNSYERYPKRNNKDICVFCNRDHDALHCYKL